MDRLLIAEPVPIQGAARIAPRHAARIVPNHLRASGLERRRDARWLRSWSAWHLSYFEHQDSDGSDLRTLAHPNDRPAALWWRDVQRGWQRRVCRQGDKSLSL